MNEELMNRIEELLNLALEDLREVEDPFVDDAMASIHEALSIIIGDFGSFDQFPTFKSDQE